MQNKLSNSISVAESTVSVFVILDTKSQEVVTLLESTVCLPTFSSPPYHFLCSADGPETEHKNLTPLLTAFVTAVVLLSADAQICRPIRQHGNHHYSNYLAVM